MVTPHVGGGFGGKAGLYAEQAWSPPQRRHVAASRDVDVDPQRGHARAVAQPRPDPVRRARLPPRWHLHRTARPAGRRRRRVPVGRRLSPDRHEAHVERHVRASPRSSSTSSSPSRTPRPTGAYRGAGRPEATALLERLVDQAAIELGIDPIELRRKNLLADDVFPFTTLTGITYDSGRVHHSARRGARLAGYDELRREQVGAP